MHVLSSPFSVANLALLPAPVNKPEIESAVMSCNASVAGLTSVERPWRHGDCYPFSVDRHFMWYNFGRVHQPLLGTPTVEAGVADHVWTLDEIVGLLG